VEEKMNHWLLKTEPSDFSWDDQLKVGAKGGPWTGVRNVAANSHMKKMAKGDRAFFYHTGEEKRVVGIVEVTREAYPDPTDATGKFVCVDVKPLEALPRPVTLAAVKAEPKLADIALVRQGRLSVQPVPEAAWNAICKMGGLKG
jgi:predicted RNA-binding protein with PUA-like domain